MLNELAMPLRLAAAPGEQLAAGQTPSHLVCGSGLMGHLELITEQAASPGWVPATAVAVCYSLGKSCMDHTGGVSRPQEVQGVPHSILPRRMGNHQKGPYPEPWAP